jgi:hypothetical protein
MTIERKIDEASNCATYTLSGGITGDDIMNALELFFRDNPKADVLWDLRKAEFGGKIATADLERIARFIKQKYPLRTRGKTALLASSDLAFGLAREYEVIAEIAGVKNPIKVFRSMEKAKEWLDSETNGST